MDISASEWSTSGCESGWTVYLDESSLSPNKSQRRVLDDDHHQNYKSNANADYEEDLSMVSDASSGPPHFQYGVEGEEEEVDCYRGARFLHPSSSSSEKSKKKKNNNNKEPRTKNQHSFLDDTASSPAFSYPNVNRCTDPSNNQQSMDQNHLFGYSQENGFMGNPAFGNQYGFWPSSHPKQQDFTESSRSRGRRRG